ncbi:MAG: DUF5069 domain-containing protein [Candidatus Eremiobacteraeota bacterium]|nr:DUF5069 domain-containing protein [Candidatus Eremiobacteraeota bacterium]
MEEIRDLSQGPPRRWNEEIGGIKWLPRLIDKTRAAMAGKLGLYLYGQSPIDNALLRALGLRYRDFTKIVANAATDDDVFRQLAIQCADGIQRARDWSARLPQRHRLFMFILDLDDGHHRAWHLRVLKRPSNVLANLVAAGAKKLWPSRAGKIET